MNCVKDCKTFIFRVCLALMAVSTIFMLGAFFSAMRHNFVNIEAEKITFLLFCVCLFALYLLYTVVAFIRFVAKGNKLTKTKCIYLIIAIVLIIFNGYLANLSREKAGELTPEKVESQCNETLLLTNGDRIFSSF